MTEGKLADGAVTEIKLGANAVPELKIANGAATNAKLADMPPMTIKGNDGGTTADPKDLTVAGLVAMLNSGGAFESSELTIPGSGGPITAAHGLGTVPKSFDGYLRCKVAEFGYAVGDEVKCFANIDGGEEGFQAYATRPWSASCAPRISFGSGHGPPGASLISPRPTGASSCERGPSDETARPCLRPRSCKSGAHVDPVADSR